LKTNEELEQAVKDPLTSAIKCLFRAACDLVHS